MDRALSVSQTHPRAEVALKYLALTAIVAVFSLITFGGVVRVTESGLGCPDWPLCHGGIIPPADATTLIEYFHRLLAGFTGLLILSVAFLVWKIHPQNRLLIRLMATIVVLLIVQVGLGGATVLTELSEGLVVAHLAMAEVFLGCLIVSTVILWRTPTEETAPQIPDGARDYNSQRPVLLSIALVAVFILLMTGAYVRASGATVACGDTWPLCSGEIIRGGTLSVTHMIHRIFTIPVAGLVVAALVETWRLGRGRPSYLRVPGLLLAGTFIAQVLIGGFNVWLAFPGSITVLHLSAATLVFALLVWMTALAWPSMRSHATRTDHA